MDRDVEEEEEEKGLRKILLMTRFPEGISGISNVGMQRRLF
jgi:hypothetical protein